MKPILLQFDIGEITVVVGSYRFFGMLAALLLIITGFRVLRKYCITYGEIAALSVGFALLFMMGARLLYGLLYWKRFLDDPLTIIEPVLHNFTLHGGFLAITFGGVAYCMRRRIPFWTAADEIAPWIALSAAILKIGCFLNGCCYGTVTEMPQGICFPILSPAYYAQLYQGKIGLFSTALPVHPTQLYEAVAALIAAAVSWRTLSWMRRNSAALPGVPALVMITFLSIGRLIVFYFREFPVADPVSDFIRGPVILGGTAAISTVCILIMLAGSNIFRKRFENVSHQEE